MADWRTELISAVGGRPTPAAMAFLTGWQKKEGGHTHNKATYNWLNRTDKGYPTINSVGVAAYPNQQTGIARTAELLQRGYPTLFNSLRSGAIDYANPGVQGDLNRWLSGNRTPGMTPYVQSVARLAGQNVGAAAPVGGLGAAPTTPSPVAQPSIRSVMPLIGAIAARRKQRAAGERPSLAPMLGAIMALRQAGEPMQQSGVVPAVPGAGGSLAPSPNMVVTSQGWKPTAHAGGVTSGLGWNDKGVPGDIMARAGTPVGAPVSGVITRRGSAQGGSSLYLMGDDGNEYWLGHIEDALPEGTRVKANQPIATISSRHKAPHLHITKRRVR